MENRQELYIEGCLSYIPLRLTYVATDKEQY